jgi:hypothetical protein
MISFLLVVACGWICERMVEKWVGGIVRFSSVGRGFSGRFSKLGGKGSVCEVCR